jgi:small subunit ribosomal protein S18
MAGKTRAPKRGAKDAPRKGGKKKVCIFCADKIDWVDYKDINVLRRFQSDRGKIRARRVTGNCNQHQNEVANAIKTARELALLPYSQRTVTESRGERRGGRGGPGGRRDDREDRDDDVMDEVTDEIDDAKSADDEAVDEVVAAADTDGEGGDE